MRNNNKKLSQEEFLRRVKVIFDNSLDFSESIYINTLTKVKVLCPKHGEFYIVPNLLFAGNGCQKCRHGENGYKKPPTQDEVAKIFEDRGYKLIDEYENSNKPMRYVCPKHPDKDTSISLCNLKSGQGCWYCGVERRTQKNRIDISTVKNAFDEVGYKLVSDVYKNKDTKLDYLCPHHGLQSIRYNDLRDGVRCPCCAKYGFDPEKVARVYILETSDWVKIGITNNKVSDRVRKINNGSPQKFCVLYSVECLGKVARSVEFLILTWLRKHHKSPPYSFEGVTETFLKQSHTVEQMIKMLNKEVEKW